MVMLPMLGTHSAWSMMLLVRVIREGQSQNSHSSTLRGEALTVDQALAVFRLTADALQHLHSTGYVHLDISLKNIGFRAKPRHGVPLLPSDVALFDFGLTIPVGSRCGNQGTRRYMEPARIKIQGPELIAHPGMDVYSLALVLRTMLSGHEPTVIPNTSEQYSTWRKQLYAPIPMEQLKFGPGVSPDVRNEVGHQVQRILHSCLKPDDPVHRPSAATLVAEAERLERMLNERTRQGGHHVS
jgi:serine/threonine protein kinase